MRASWQPRSLVLAGLVALALASCGAPEAGPAPSSVAAPATVALDVDPETGEATTGSTRGSVPAGPADGSTAATSATAASGFAPTTTTLDTRSLPAPRPDCASQPWSRRPPPGAGTVERNPVPAEARAELEAAVAELGRGGGAVGVSVWSERHGVVLEVGADTEIAPASNQKLFVGAAALALLPVEQPLSTTVVATGPVVDGVLDGDLVLVGGGDPTLSATGPHSLESLAAALARAGITRVEGQVLVDDTRFDQVHDAPGWTPEGVTQTVGAVSALVVDRNRGGDPSVTADPALAAGRRFRETLLLAGIEVPKTGITRAVGYAGTALAELPSPPIASLATSMLSLSDSMAAEVVLKELGRRAPVGSSPTGSSAAGIATVAALLDRACGLRLGTSVDGSGFSHQDRATAGDLRRLLQWALAEPWADTFRSALPVAGRTGTLSGRLGGPATAGVLRAKTGALSISTALSGYVTTARGDEITFSILLGSGAPDAQRRVDDFATALATAL